MRSYTQQVLKYTSSGMVLAAGAEVRVYLAGTSTPATVYSDDGTTQIIQPFYSDADGWFIFWAPNGEYDIQITRDDATTETIQNVSLYDLNEEGAPWFDVTDAAYGAVGDGVTDDSAAIQAAIDAAEAQGGGEVFFPHGTYLLQTAGITVSQAGVTLVGVGPGEYVGAAPSGGSVIKCGTTALDPLVKFIGGGGQSYNLMGARGLQFNDGGNYKTGNLIDMEDVQQGIFMDCLFYHNSATAPGDCTVRIYTSGAGQRAGRNRFMNCIFHQPKWTTGTVNAACYGLKLENAAGAQNSANVFVNCLWIDNSAGASYSIHTSGGVGSNFYTNGHVQISSARNGGIYLDGTDGGEMFSNINVDGTGTGYDLITLTANSKNCYFIGYIDGVINDSNADDEKMQYFSPENHSGPHYRAVNLMPRVTASLPVSPEEGTVCYDNTLNKLVVYTGAAWETVTSA